jgi:hypothetical protein
VLELIRLELIKTEQRDQQELIDRLEQCAPWLNWIMLRLKDVDGAIYQAPLPVILVGQEMDCPE